MSSITLDADTKAVAAALNRIPAKLRGAALRKAVLAGGEEIAVAARVNAPYRKGKLRRAIKARIFSAKSGFAVANVSWRSGKASRTKAFYGLFSEVGTKERTRKSGGRTGSVDAKPFLVPAFDRRKDIAKEVARKALADELQRLPKPRKKRKAK